MTGPLYISVSGSGDAPPEVIALAEEVGSLLAAANAIVVCGGLGGVMEAVCRAAKSAGGVTVGILPGTARSDANDFVDVALPTGLGESRNALVARAGDALIAIGGEFGTLSEIALAIKIGRPVIGLGTWELHRDGEVVRAIKPVATPVEAVDLALRLARGAPYEANPKKGHRKVEGIGARLSGAAYVDLIKFVGSQPLSGTHAHNLRLTRFRASLDDTLTKNDADGGFWSEECASPTRPG